MAQKTAAWSAGVTPGAYTNINATVDTQGLLTAVASGTIGTPALGYAIIPIEPTWDNDPASAMEWDTAIYDPLGIRTNATQLTIPSTGLWQIALSFYGAGNAAENVTVTFNLNAAVFAVYAVVSAVAPGTQVSWNISPVWQLTASDVITVDVSGGGTLSQAVPVTAGYNTITLVKLSS